MNKIIVWEVSLKWYPPLNQEIWSYPNSNAQGRGRHRMVLYLWTTLFPLGNLIFVCQHECHQIRLHISTTCKWIQCRSANQLLGEGRGDKVKLTHIHSHSYSVHITTYMHTHQQNDRYWPFLDFFEHLHHGLCISSGKLLPEAKATNSLPVETLTNGSQTSLEWKGGGGGGARRGVFISLSHSLNHK